MGSSFSNLQVQLGPGVTVAAVAEAVAARASLDGQDRLTPEDGRAPDRTVVVVPVAGWIAIYDEALEQLGEDRLAPLAEHVSAAVKGAVVAVEVAHSSRAALWLYEAGRLVDAHRVPLQDGAGTPERWVGVLAEGARTEALGQAFADEPLFPEQVVATVAELLGAPPGAMATGFHYAPGARHAPGAVTLRFALRERPAWEAPAEGPPRFEAWAWTMAEPTAVGDTLTVGAPGQNRGGLARGLSVRVFGSALAQGLVEVGQLVLTIGARPGAQHSTLTLEPQEGVDGPELVTVLPEVEVPAGSAVGMGDGPPEALPYMMRSNVSALATVRVVRPGRGELSVALTPLEHPAGALVTTRPVVASPPLARPLRAGAETPSQILQPLLQDRYAVGLVAFDAPRVDVVDEVWATFEALARELGPRTHEVVAFHADKAPRPRAMAGLDLASLRPDMIEARSVMVGGLLDRGPDPGAHGLLFGGAFVPSPDASERELATASWWADIGGLEREVQQAVLQILADAIGRATEGGAVQGFLSRWGSRPTGVDTTPYEVACGTFGPPNTLRSHLIRWLRAPGNELTWLGADLIAQLSGEALARARRCAEVTPAGPGWQLRLRSREELPALEEALAGLLATAEDYRQITQRYYRPPGV